MSFPYLLVVIKLLLTVFLMKIENGLIFIEWIFFYEFVEFTFLQLEQYKKVRKIRIN